MRRVPPVLIAAALACVGAVFMFGAAFVGALSVEPLPERAPAVTDSSVVEPTRQASPLTTDALMLAVDSDPFRPERQRAPERYRLPGDELPAEPAAPPPPPPAPPFRLIGTAVTPTGGLAVISIEDNTRVIDVGESLLGYTLTAVDADRAIMVGPERTVQLPLVATVVGGANPRGARPGPQGPGAGAARPTQDAARELLERVRAGGGNVTPQMMEMIQRMQQDGRSVDVQTQPGRVMIRARPDTTDAAPSASFLR